MITESIINSIVLMTVQTSVLMTVQTSVLIINNNNNNICLKSNIQTSSVDYAPTNVLMWYIV